MRSSRHTCSLSAEFSLVKENILLQDERITQLFVIQSERDPFCWFGVLFVDNGIYKGAVVRFTIYIDETYPDCSCPQVIFDPIPYHPLVDPITGKLDTKNAFPDWSSNTHRLHQLLLFVKRVICHAEVYIKQIKELMTQDQLDQLTTTGFTSNNIDLTQSPVRYSENLDEHSDDARTLLNSNEYSTSFRKLFSNYLHSVNTVQTYFKEPEKFRDHVEKFTQRCCHQLFDKPKECDDDRNALVFTPWDADIHEHIRNCVLTGKFAPTRLFASYHKETESVSFIPGTEPT